MLSSTNLQNNHSVRPPNNSEYNDTHLAIYGGQINLHKSQGVVANLMVHLASQMQTGPLGKNIFNSNSLQAQNFIIGVQEPPVNRGLISGFSNMRQLFYKKGTDARAAIYASSNLNTWPMPEYTEKDISTCLIKGKEKEIIFSSVYMDINEEPWSKTLKKLIRFCSTVKKELVIVSDTNCHSTLWGSRETNARGEIFEMNLLQTDLEIMNVGRMPTFFNRRSSTIIDVTLASASLAASFEGWRIHPSFVGSDHHLIEFNLTISIKKLPKVRSFRKGDWTLFSRYLEDKLALKNEFWTTADIERHAEFLRIDLQNGLDLSHPKRRLQPKRELPCWWNQQASELLKQVKHCNSWYRNLRNNNAFTRLVEARRKYTNFIQKQKRSSWRTFTEECKTIQDLSRLNKIMQRKENNSLGILLNNDSTFCRSPEETMNLLLDTHFPGSSDPVEEDCVSTQDQIYNIKAESVSFITPRKVRLAINSFGNLKAAGVDGIKPIVLKNLGSKRLRRLVDIFKASSLSGYIPKSWRQSKVVFIPKPGKDDYSKARSFRPISLSSFILKTLERVWGWHLEETFLKIAPLNVNQHAFRRGFSTETALSNMTEYIESAFIKKGFALSVFLDIEGAFDNVSADSIIKGMEDKNLPNTFMKWYGALLKSRNIVVDFNGTLAKRALNKGTPQGGVLSPLAWNLAFESFLELFQEGQVKVCGFADDAALVIVGDEVAHLYHRMQKAIDKVLEWGQTHGLKFSPTKTVAVLFTKNRKFKTGILRMNGQEIPLSDNVKYLGVTLDKKLNWNAHIDHKIRKSKNILFAARNAMGKLWGPSPANTIWIFNAIVKPALSYGALVWNRACEKKTIIQRLTKLNRLSLLLLGNFRRSTPTAGLEIILHQPPLHLWIKKEALSAYLRTMGHRRLPAAELFTQDRNKVGHRQICREMANDYRNK